MRRNPIDWHGRRYEEYDDPRYDEDRAHNEEILTWLKRVVRPSDRIVMSPEPFSADALRDTARQEVGAKPIGLWYAVGLSWAKWCMGEQPDWLARYKYLYRLDLDESNVLRLRTAEDVLWFNTQFGRLESRWSSAIDWRQVAARSSPAGIEIAPYQYDLRLDARVCWYYGWDVASGCLWRPRGAILSVEEIDV